MYDWSSSMSPSVMPSMLVSVVVERMYDWSFIRLVVKSPLLLVSVVVERMYDWSRYWRRDGRTWTVSVVVERMYDWSLLVSNNGVCHFVVSVVVERMYDWSFDWLEWDFVIFKFQLLLKGCTIEALIIAAVMFSSVCFSCCWKDVRLKQYGAGRPCKAINVSVVVERMYDWSLHDLRDCKKSSHVSVVVERMYDWSVIELISRFPIKFQLLLKGCTIEACSNRS